MSRPSWDDYFLDLAAVTAGRSTCPRRQVGAVLVRDRRVLATGYNGSVHGAPHCDEVGCLMIDGHCRRTVHAELNALLQCAVFAASPVGGTLYVTDSPCLECAKAAVQCGVDRVVYRNAYPDPDSAAMLQQGGVALLRATGSGPTFRLVKPD